MNTTAKTTTEVGSLGSLGLSDPPHPSDLSSRLGRGGGVRRLLLPVAVALLLFVVAWLTTPEFATAANLTNVVLQMSVIGIVAVGLSFITVSGNFFALSTGTSAAFVALVLAKASEHGAGPWVVLVLALVVGTALGLAQGVIVAIGGNPIIVTLGAAAALTGSISLLSGGVSVPWPGDLDWLGAKFAGTWTMVATVVVATLLLRFSSWGRRMALVGASRPSSVNVGINVGVSTVIAFSLFGFTCALAGILQAARFGEVVSTNYTSLDLAAVAAVLIGGISVAGGRGSPVQAVVGAFLLSLLGNVAILRGWTTGWQQIFVGLAVILVVLAMAWSSMDRPGRRRGAR